MEHQPDELIGKPIEEVPQREPAEYCNSRRTDDGRFLGYCQRTSGWGTDGDQGRCRTHGQNGGAPEGNDNAVGNDGGAPENNDHAETHTLTSDPQQYYDRQDDDAQERIDEWARSWARRADYQLPGYDSILHEQAVTLHQIHAADAYIADEGVIVERVIGRTESGDPIVKEEENPAFALKSRAMKGIIRTLKEFGCLDDPDSQTAEAVGDLASIIQDEA